MCDFHVELEAVRDSCETPVEGLTSSLSKLEPLIADELVVVDGWCMDVLPRGRMVVRMACAVFDQYHTSNPSKPAHAKAI